MALVQTKCPNCGSQISVDDTMESALCNYCGAKFQTEKAITPANNTANYQVQVVNNYTSPNNHPEAIGVKVARRPRPKMNWRLFVLGLVLYIVPGVLYFVVVKIKQKKWDDKYTY